MVHPKPVHGWLAFLVGHHAPHVFSGKLVAVPVFVRWVEGYPVLRVRVPGFDPGCVRPAPVPLDESAPDPDRLEDHLEPAGKLAAPTVPVLEKVFGVPESLKLLAGSTRTRVGFNRAPHLWPPCKHARGALDWVVKPESGVDRLGDALDHGAPIPETPGFSGHVL